jgi:hypothetical protein
MFRDLDTIPVLAREGAIVPMYCSGLSNELDNAQPLEIHIWRGNGSFELYEDDGESNRKAHLLTRLQVEETGDGLRFTIHASEGDRSLVPERRQVRLIFRDVISADAFVDGQSAEFCRDGMVLNPETCAGAVVELKNIAVAVNPRKTDLRTSLLTRVQGEIIWKNAILGSEKKMPKALREALGELDALKY